MGRKYKLKQIFMQIAMEFSTNEQSSSEYTHSAGNRKRLDGIVKVVIKEKKKKKWSFPS